MRPLFDIHVTAALVNPFTSDEQPSLPYSLLQEGMAFHDVCQAKPDSSPQRVSL